MFLSFIFIFIAKAYKKIFAIILIIIIIIICKALFFIYFFFVAEAKYGINYFTSTYLRERERRTKTYNYYDYDDDDEDEDVEAVVSDYMIDLEWEKSITRHWPFQKGNQIFFVNKAVWQE